MAVEKNRHNEQFFSDKVKAEESANKAKESKLTEAGDKISQLQLNLMEKDEKINTLTS